MTDNGSDNRPLSYPEGKIQVYRASRFGGCITEVAAIAAGYEPHRHGRATDIMMTAAKEGDRHEGHVLEDLVEAGHRFDGWPSGSGVLDQPAIEIQVLKRALIRGHLDAIGYPPRARKERGYEIKSMSAAVFKEWMGHKDFVSALLSDRFARYGWQLSAYMAATKLPFLYVVKNRSSGRVEIEEITFPPYSLKDIKKRVIELEKWRVKDELPPCTGRDQGFFCSVPDLHVEGIEDEVGDEGAPVVSVTDDELVAMAEKYDELRAMEDLGKAAGEEKRAIGDEIMRVLGGKKGIKKKQVEGWVLSRTDSKGKVSVDWGGLALALKVEYGVEVGAERLEKLSEETGKRNPYSYMKVRKM